MYHFEFQYPYVFILLLLTICIFKCPYLLKKFFFPHLYLFEKFSSSIERKKLFYALIFTLLITALASPITYDAKLSNKREGRDIVFALDTSGSMNESHFSQEDSKKSKFEILKMVLKDFIKNRFDDNVGVAIFGSYAYAAIPLTYDMKSVEFLLDFFDVGIAGDSTAIGEGLASSLRILQKGEAKNKVIVLITDGYQNSGSVSVKEAVENAKKMHVKIYTIGISKESNYDAKLLQKIAKESGAKSYLAKDAQLLQKIYKEIDRLEPSKIRSQNYLNKQLLYIYPLTIAALLLLFIISRDQERTI